MEEDRIKELFREYDPELSSSKAFINRLERHLDAVEMIHRENAAVMKRNRVAVIAAACAGFISGMIFTLLLPYLVDIVGYFIETLTGLLGNNGFYGYHQAISWIFVGAVSVFVALNTYDITLSLLPLRDGKQED